LADAAELLGSFPLLTPRPQRAAGAIVGHEPEDEPDSGLGNIVGQLPWGAAVLAPAFVVLVADVKVPAEALKVGTVEAVIVIVLAGKA